ncbi:uncharacterized protein PAC_10172 [Phialocephala subalpina]|uniref:Uncharacterized protein n=1 Tax=Phialocephala subalpina TaxID=576137 RepID=A0A1L7X5H0_9HELO|nr:uncharacterized protein PAC_10172 [Phialocephala subalpina]
MTHNTIMKLFAFLLTFLPLILVSGLAIGSESTIEVPEGYTISGAMGFKGTLHGVEVELSGTIEEMYANFTSQYPEVVANAKANANPTAAYLPTSNVGLAQLESRNPSPRGDHYCCPINGQPNWLPAEVAVLVDGINYLNNFQGVCNTGGGPGNCVRVSCSYSAAIYLCNDNEGDLVISCKDVAFYAGQIINYCRVIWGHNTPMSCGQIFDNANYNVIVHMAGC